MTSENKNLTSDEKERDEALKEGKKPRKLRSLIIEISVYVVIAAVAIFIVPKYLIGRVPVNGPSMENTLFDGDQLLGELVTTYTENYERFDIIFFHPHGRDSEDIYIKRIIALPYESVRIDEEGTIFVNGVPLDESFGKDRILDPGRAGETIYLGEGEYFVLGDNRNNSLDSRSEDVGNVKKENIDGVVLLRIWPLSEFGKVD